MLSVVIPSYKDPYLHKTIDDILENAEGEIEIIPVLDGYWTDHIRDDPRVKLLHLGQNRGMRGAINAGVDMARGEFIMRTDEHCHFAKGFDKAILEDIQDNWIMTARRFCLNPETWTVMEDIPPSDFNKLSIIVTDGGKSEKFSAMEWPERNKEMANEMVGETLGMQGSFWIMKKSWWEKVIVELQSEGYGTHYQDSHEMVFKTWKAGGKLMLTKKTWYAHKHRKFPRTHGYGGQAARDGWKYSLDTWRDYYEQEIKPKWKI